MFTRGNPYATQAKVVAHADRLAEWLATGDSFPVLVEINPINHCNQACDWCINGDVHLGRPEMSLETRRLRIAALDEHSAITGHPERRNAVDLSYLRRFLDEASALGLRAVNWSGGGEPTSYSHFQAAVEHATSLGLDQGLLTNGLFRSSLTTVIRAHLCWVRVSLDTLDPDRYSARRHSAGFESVVRNVKMLVAGPARVIVNMNVADWNADEIMPLARWARDTGVHGVQFRPVLPVPFEQSSPMPTPTGSGGHLVRERLLEAEGLETDSFEVRVSWDKFNDVQQEDFGRTYSKCLAHHLVCVLNANGDLCVCMYHLDDQRFTFGNICAATIRSADRQ